MFDQTIMHTNMFTVIRIDVMLPERLTFTDGWTNLNQSFKLGEYKMFKIVMNKLIN